MKKISFDFDDTLSRPIVQDIAKKLIKWNYDVYITTSRYEDVSKYLRPNATNDDLFKIAEELNIDKSKIRFTNFEDKYIFLKDFYIHLDDDWIELNMINSKTKCIGISVYGTSKWKHKLMKLINE